MNVTIKKEVKTTRGKSMVLIADKAYNDKVDQLISQINLIKLRLIAKHGPSIKKQWGK